MSGPEKSRDEGVDFSDINPVLEDLSYPISQEEFVTQYGKESVERTNAGPITVAELFDGMGEQTFEAAEEIRQSVLNLMPRESVGLQRYSDRAGSIPEEGGGPGSGEQESL